MTTLPQTTTVRLPRPASPTALAQPGAGVASSAAAQMSAADMWRVIRANMWLIVISLVVAAVGGFVVNMVLARYCPRYTCRVYVQVEPPVSRDPFKDNSQGADRNVIELEQKTQAQLLKSEILANEVLADNTDVRNSQWFHGFATTELAKQNLLDTFVANPVLNSKLIEVSMTCANPGDCKTIVQAMVDQHIKDQLKLAREHQQELTQGLNNMKDESDNKLREIGQELREKAVRLSIDGMGTPGRLSAKEVELQGLLTKQLEIEMDLNKAKSAYESAVAQVNNGGDPPAVSEIIERNPNITLYKQELDGIDAQIADSAARLGVNNPTVVGLQKRRDAYQQKLDAARAEARANARATVIEEFRNQAELAQGAYDGMNKQIAAAKQELGNLTNDMSVYLTRKDEETAQRDLRKEVDEQLEVARRQSTLTDVAGITYRTLPFTPDTRSFPKLPITMSVAILLGLAFSLGIAFLREVLDTSVRSPRDIVRIGQMSVLGMIPDENDDPQAAGARLPLMIFESPHSLMAEQFRQVRSRLQHAASLDTTRSLLVTSPGPEDGKSTVACNLAAGLALNGRKILLVDANFRRPELHKVFAVGNDKGFSDVLNSLEEFAAAVRETPVPNLSLLTAGARPGNATEMLESQLLIDFLERALTEYDHVIFDSGPLLFVADTVALAPRVDGVVSVVRAQSNSRGQLQRMRDALRQIKAEHLGVVLNAVRAQGGGYYARNIKTYYEYQNGQPA